MRWAVAAALVLEVAFCSAGRAAGAKISGVPRVVDGDTIRLGETRIRLHGIDAPESDQLCNSRGGGTWACGKEATRALSDMLVSGEVTCEPITLDRYGRTVARCFLGSADIQADMVRRGLSWAFVKYSRDYVLQEADARAAGVGIWQAETTPAWDYRAMRWAEYDKTAPAG